MKVRVAYSGYDRIGEVIEFEFDWDSVTGVDPEEATVTQIQYAVREAVYQETGIKEPIGAFVILDGDPYEMIQNL